MTYKQNNVTYIDDLPDIDEFVEKPVSHGMSMIPPNDASKFKKFIRPTNSNHTPVESGMSPNTYPSQQQQMMYNYQDQPHSSGGFAPHQEQYYERYNNNNHQNNLPKLKDIAQPTCVDVADHTANCSVCSKLYNNDRTIYIIAIAILCIICILLLKRVLDV
jgi:hypothetical protein